MISLGKKVAFVAEQTGHSIRTLETQAVTADPAPGISSTFSLHPEAKVEKKGGA
jgi:hypothetical protein